MAEDDTHTTPAETDSSYADPSPAPETATETTPSSGSDTQDAPSSGDTPLSDREGLLAAVRAVVQPKAPPADDASAAEPEPDKDTAGTAPGQPGATPPDGSTQPTFADPTEADLKKLRPETRRRFEQLLHQRDEARQTLNALTPEIEQHRQLQGYLQQHQLAPDDVNTLLGVGAALRRGDFQAFLNGVAPYVQAAQEALGLRFAPDLQRQIDDGMITEETARELAQTRFRANAAEERYQQEAGARQQEAQGQALTAIRSAVEYWENTIKQRDPDYALKAVAIQRFSQALMQERGAPTTPQTAVNLVHDAYQQANEMFARVRPPPRPTRPAPSGINGTSHGADAEPRSMKEAVLMSLNMRRAS